VVHIHTGASAVHTLQRVEPEAASVGRIPFLVQIENCGHGAAVGRRGRIVDVLGESGAAWEYKKFRLVVGVQVLSIS